MSYFVKGTTYELVNFDGLVDHLEKYDIYQQWLPYHIQKMGNTIHILNADAQGNAFGIRFGDGTIYNTTHLNASMVKFFEPLSPIAVEAVMPVPKKFDGAESNIIRFPRKPTDENLDEFFDAIANIVNVSKGNNRCTVLTAKMPKYSSACVSSVTSGIEPRYCFG